MSKKLLFWLDGFHLPYCVAYGLQKKYDFDLYAIIDIPNNTKNFFQKQQFVKFQNIWFLYDHITKNQKYDINFLINIEKKYNIELWKLSINERFFYQFNPFHRFSSDEILSIVEQECRLFEDILDKVKPDFLITTEPAFSYHQIFYEICKAKGVRVLMLRISRIGYKCIISHEFQKFDTVNSLDVVKGQNRNFDDLLNYRKSFDRNQQEKDYIKGRIGTQTNFLKGSLEFLISENSDSETNFTSYGRTKFKVALNRIKLILKKKSRQAFIDKNFEKKINFNEKFVYFALSIEQERSTLIAAPYFTNQVEVIRHIAKSLPIDYKLYVKEHPGNIVRFWRKISDYKEIINIPNVRLIHPSISPEDLYKNCSLVITISGTAGFDAAFYQKPSIIFSDLKYSILPSVQQITSQEDLPKAIRTSLTTKVDSSDLDKYLILLDKNSFDFDLPKFQIKLSNTFYYGGNLANVEIPQSKMEVFLNESQSEIETLVTEYIKKIKQFEESKKPLLE